ncbi:zinc finger and BTB domain-containing protein 41-like isoform X6 [Cydia strobilella]|uniref:zinc finger and BTB domain-containing protein 41-like isoform X6 n=1 Tax=Cydia strobilella TaxID=1100964 RepID=UPI003006A0CE
MEGKSTDWVRGPSGPTVCRCCFTEGCYKDISTEYFWMGKREVYCEMLTETFDLSIAFAQTSGPNSNSRLICEPCISRLRDASEFKRQVQECEKMFMQYLDPGRTTVDELQMETTQEPLEKGVKLEPVKLEKNHSDDDFDDRGGFDDMDEDDLDDQPLTRLASKVPKKESVDLLDLLDNAKAEKRKSSTKTKSSPAKKAKTKKETPKATASKAKPEKKKKGSDSPILPEIQKQKRIVPLFQVAYDRSLCKPLGTILDFDKIDLKLRSPAKTDHYPPTTSRDYTPSRSPSPVSNSGHITPPQAGVVGNLDPPVEVLVPQKNKKRPDIRQNALTVFENSTVYPFIYGNNKFKCFVCSQPFLETVELSRHMQECHGFSALKRLVNNRRENVLKVDVCDMVCKICSLKPKDLAELKHHLKEAHQKPIDPELKDNMIPFRLDGREGSYKCVMCDEEFIKIRILVIHMSVHFNNYSCEICGSGFMTLRLLKKHLEVHENGNFPCDRCNKVFTTPHKRSLHIRGVHLKQYPRRCPICPERFNSNYRRTIHLQDVHNQSTRVHKCETCGRGFNLKYHLICHTRSVHLQERNQQCDVCHQRFCNKETLKRHMVIHTGEKNYKCEVCGMAFLRRKNLKDHLRLHEGVLQV